MTFHCAFMARCEDLVSRAAGFRMEASVLRARAEASEEPVIRDQYLVLADRWSNVATSLEAALFDQTTLL
jgi:hypothetical protein